MTIPLRFPERIKINEHLECRVWRIEDAAIQRELVNENLDHLRPWMSWVGSNGPTPAEATKTITDWQEGFNTGLGDAFYGIFWDDNAAGSCGLHRRIAEDGLEIGYWTSQRFLGRGIATAVASALTTTALSLPGLTHTEIHVDQANTPSNKVAKRLDYQLVETINDEITAPAETGLTNIWRMSATTWRRLGNL